MTVQFVPESPRQILEFHPGNDDPQLQAGDVRTVAEIFNTPLTGAFNWDYRIQDNRIKKLYELGKRLNWNAETDIDWTREVHAIGAEEREMINSFTEYPPYMKMSEQRKDEFGDHMNAWSLSQFLHGEQGALLVASQLTSCAPTYNAKLYAASQTFDEARHVEVFNKYLQTKVGLMYPIDQALKNLLDKILTDARWDLKFIGMQLVIEGLALSAFNAMRMAFPEGLLSDIIELVIRDEARHVTFGINYLEEHLAGLSEDERNDRAMFAYEACVVTRERMIPTDVFHEFGWDVEEARAIYLEGEFRVLFRDMMFSRIMPNLRRIGLLTDAVKPKFEELGILQLADEKDDGDIDWAELSKPLPLANAANA